ncbi:MAG: 3-ketoacyl-ACP reductase [Desulfobacterales bacterium]|jgi:NAD(P)-dependent dehydrogenase (short-subunit alcohol dehydrogenase family)
MSDSRPVILVTGGSRGLGRGICLKLSECGYSVIINFVGNAEAAEKTVAECRDRKTREGQKFMALQADIGKKDDRRDLIESGLKQFGRIDALVNNAGIAPRERADILDATEASFEEIIRINLQGPYFVTQQVANYWLAQKPTPLLKAGFTVIFVTSTSAETASTNRGDYCISKAGLSMAGKLWAARLADHNIHVFELRPGIMRTDMTAVVKDKYDHLIAEGLVPQSRWGTPHDLGLAVAALLDGSFPFSTGSVIDIDGGFHIKRL